MRQTAMLFDQLDQRVDAEVSERHDLVVAWSIDPDNAVLGVHPHGDVVQPIDALAEIGRDAVDGRHTMNFVDVHSGGERGDCRGPAPVPWKKFVETMSRMPCDAR